MARKWDVAVFTLEIFDTPHVGDSFVALLSFADPTLAADGPKHMRSSLVCDVGTAVVIAVVITEAKLFVCWLLIIDIKGPPRSVFLLAEACPIN